MSYFNYCPLLWMFSSKQAYDLINSTQRRVLCARLHILSGDFTEIKNNFARHPFKKSPTDDVVIEVFKSLI